MAFCTAPAVIYIAPAGLELLCRGARTGSGNGWPVCISERARSPFNLAKEILKTALPNLAPV